MQKTLYLTNKLREELQKPFGAKILGGKKEVLRKFDKFCQRKKFEKIITVGDFCSRTLKSDVKIFDGRVERNKKIPLLKHELTLSNAPATIDKQCWSVIKKALKENRNIFVDGEEDLLVLPCILLSKENYLIVYGYPKRGICLIEVSKKFKEKIKNLLKKFKAAKFEKIVLGGTFDPIKEIPQGKIHLHSGHRYFLSMAKYYAKKALIGVSSDEFTKEKKDDWQKIHKFEQRKKSVNDFLDKMHLEHEILRLDDIYGPAVLNKDIDALLLTEETLENGLEINKERKKRGLKELSYIVIPYFLNGEGKKISSRDFR